MTAPSSASIVFSATSGSLSGRASDAELRHARRSASTAVPAGERRQIRPEPPIDEDDPRRHPAAADAPAASAQSAQRRHGSWNDASATRAQAGVFPGLLARAGGSPAARRRNASAAASPRSADHRAGARAARHSARGSRGAGLQTAAVMPPPPPCRRSPWLPARAPAPVHRSGRSDRRPARAHDPARCSRAAADSG